ncbi:MAG: hypothetical protein JWP84_5091, partial [Tardiphaga sp.]|nr:hypothetical protein [Tardiphaga sp.]
VNSVSLNWVMNRSCKALRNFSVDDTSINQAE